MIKPLYVIILLLFFQCTFTCVEAYSQAGGAGIGFQMFYGESQNNNPAQVVSFGMKSMNTGNPIKKVRFRYGPGLNFMAVQYKDSTDYYGFFSYNPEVSFRIVKRLHYIIGLPIILGYGGGKGIAGVSPGTGFEFAFPNSCIIIKAERSFLSIGSFYQANVGMIFYFH